MTTQEKKEKIQKLVLEMLKTSHEAAIKKSETVFNTGAIDVDGWDENNSPMILPKCIVTAILESEAYQYGAKGTSFERRVKKEVRNIRYFI
jgi:hypothetical protein